MQADANRTHDGAYARPDPGGASSAVAPGNFVLGRYRVISGRNGGFGTVLTCWDTRLQRRVAIKRIPLVARGETSVAQGSVANDAGGRNGRGPNGRGASIPAAGTRVAGARSGPSAALVRTGDAGRRHPAGSTVAAALAEARTASLLAHPGIVTVFDFESDDAYAYLVMEHVDGLTLAELQQRVEGGTLTGDEVAYIMASVASALDYAHDNGVLHLDIKPTNIIIDAGGTVKLCDFGMATLASAAGYGDARGGTVGYMPPEQVTGEMVDERADVFSLAVVAWQMLTGSDPFAAPSADASLRLMRRGPARALSETLADVNPAVDDVMASALSPDPAGRLASAGDLSRSLGALLGDEKAGASSIAYLLEQATSDDEPGDEEALPVAFRYPWLAGAITRCSAALTTCAALAAPCATLLAGQSAAATAATVAAAGAVSALWTPAGSVIAVLALATALVRTSDGVASIMGAGVSVIAATLWWACVAKRNRHATTALLAPVALHAPVAGAAIAGCYLPPARAAVTGAAAWLFAHLHAAAVAAGFGAEAAMGALSGAVLTGEGLVAVFGVALASAVTSAATRHARGHAGVVAGLVAGSLIVIATQLAAPTMENADYVVSPTWSSVGVAVVLCIAMGIVTTICDATADEEEA